MKFTKFSKYTGEPADSVDLEELVKRLGDFFLQSGFESQYYGISEFDPERSMEALRAQNGFAQGFHGAFWIEFGDAVVLRFEAGLQEEVAEALDQFFEVDAVGGFAGVFAEFGEFHLRLVPMIRFLRILR